MKNFKAKSSGVSILNHSRNVSNISKELVNRYNVVDEFKNSVKISSLLHDIGKCTKNFQKFLEDIESKDKRNYTHQEISWSVISRHLNVSKYELNLILDSVYWHHGFPYFKKYNEKEITNYTIYDSLDVDDLENIKKTMKELVGEEYFSDECVNDEIFPPLFYETIELKRKTEIAEKILARSIIISADRISSEIEKELSNEEYFEIPETNLKNFINKLLLKNCHSKEYITPEKFNNERFLNQKKIVNKIKNTCFINAPAGFGKTMIGFLKSLESNKKMIWVCPRNIVAEQVYRELEDLICQFGIGISVELFYAGEMKKCNKKSNGFESDIIVTNIDNFLSPSVDSGKMNDLYYINDCDVVFDEYHELITEGALFSCFVNIMNVRHRYTKSDTILLSATPFDISFMWDTPFNQSSFLPEKNKHFTPSHDKKYFFIFKELPDVYSLKLEKDNNNLILLNSIKNAQNVYKNLDKKILIHSGYLENDRIELVEKIYKIYGKYSKEEIKTDVVSSLVLQASMDISFKNLYESVLSPQSTLQRIGRVNRWGEYESANLNIIKFSDKAEDGVKKILYEHKLSNNWYYFLKKNAEGKELSLKEIYEIFNHFCVTNKKEIEDFVKENFSKSCILLSNIYPIKYFNKNAKINNDVKNSESNKLRLITSNIFFICKRTESDKYTEVFNQQIYKTIGEDFHEKGDMIHKFKKTYLALVEDERFNFKDLLENIDKSNIDIIRKMAKKSNTPYIRYDVKYDKELGIIDSE